MVQKWDLMKLFLNCLWLNLYFNGNFKDWLLFSRLRKIFKYKVNVYFSKRNIFIYIYI